MRMQGVVKLAKINADTEGELCQAFGIKSYVVTAS
jgi:thioredoxin-like negative regulator of GroEL